MDVLISINRRGDRGKLLVVVSAVDKNFLPNFSLLVQDSSHKLFVARLLTQMTNLLLSPNYDLWETCVSCLCVNVYLQNRFRIYKCTGVYLGYIGKKVLRYALNAVFVP